MSIPGEDLGAIHSALAALAGLQLFWPELFSAWVWAILSMESTAKPPKPPLVATGWAPLSERDCQLRPGLCRWPQQDPKRIQGYKAPAGTCPF